MRLLSWLLSSVCLAAVMYWALPPGPGQEPAAPPRVGGQSPAALGSRSGDREVSGHRVAAQAAEIGRLYGLVEQGLVRERVLAQRLAEAGRLMLAAHRDRAEAAESAFSPLPEGLRLCLRTLREQLVADGHDGLRPLRATALEDKELHGVEFLEYDDHGFLLGYLVARRMTAELVRDRGVLELRFFEGHGARSGERFDFPEDGHVLLLEGVDGRRWEERMPYLVRASGSYPAAALSVVDPVSSAVVAQWRSRIQQLLDLADTGHRLRIQALAGVQENLFQGVLILGYRQRRLVETMEVRSLAVLVDDRAGIVQLELRSGILRQLGGESRIGAAGHRYLLSGVTPERARAIMLGQVHTVE